MSMREGWKCPQCGKIMSPDVREHNCGSVSPPHYPPPLPHYPPKPPEYPMIGTPLWPARIGTPRMCDACRKGGICNCTLGGIPVTCGIGVAQAFKGGRLS